MRIPLGGLILLGFLCTAVAADDACRLEMKGSGKAVVTRKARDGDLSIEIPGDFQATISLVQRDGAWLARDADVTATILGQKFHLRLAAQPQEEVSIEVNETRSGSGTRQDLAGVPLLGVALAIGTGKADDMKWRVEFKPPPARSSEVVVTVRSPDGEELFQLPVKLAAEQAQGAGRTWSASIRTGPLELPAPGLQIVVINHLAWSGEGHVGADSKPLTASVKVEAQFTLPGGAHGTLTAQAEATITRPAPASP